LHEQCADDRGPETGTNGCNGLIDFALLDGNISPKAVICPANVRASAA
jgi:hypothetical protein